MTMRTTRAVFLAASALLGTIALDTVSGFNTASAAECADNTARIDGYQVLTSCDAATGITSETWSKDGNLRDRANGPAYIERDLRPAPSFTRDGGRTVIWTAPTALPSSCATPRPAKSPSMHGNRTASNFEPSAEVRAAWLQKTGEQIAPHSPAAKAAPAPG